MPDIIIDTDSCEHGIGGMNITSRFLWRWEIPQQYRNRTSLNSLEFLASVVGVAMEFEHTTTVPQESCILVGGDSTTASTGSGCDDPISHPRPQSTYMSPNP
eukprot:scaffold62029_cov65-Attheya_sp.AAC.3